MRSPYPTAVIVVLVLCLGSLAHKAYPAMRGPGKYSGVVVFDRWDGCILYGGPHIMYIAETVKEDLREYEGNFVRIMAKKIYQVFSGEARIDELVYLGSGPEKGNPARLSNVKLLCLCGFGDGEPPSILVNLINTSDKEEIQISSEELAPTLLRKKTVSVDSSAAPSDGPSCALVTCKTFWIGEASRSEGQGALYGVRYAWSIGEENALPKRFVLKPREKRQIHITFGLSEGEYDFLLGYGGLHDGNCVASNLVAFDVGKDGKAKAVKVKGR